MGSTWSKLIDLTLPIVSYFSAARFNFGIRRVFGSTRIQDLWLPYHCVSTDIINNKEVVHTKGSLWKCVRASMTLAGFLPPIWEGDRLLVDGGYLNVLPADVMARLGAATIIAVDVAPQESSDTYYNYGSSISGWWLLWNRLNPFSATARVPSMGEISERLVWVSSERQLERVRQNPAVDLYLRPPVANYGTLEFDKYDEIVKKGYTYAKVQIAQHLELNARRAELAQGRDPNLPPAHTLNLKSTMSKGWSKKDSAERISVTHQMQARGGRPGP
mmetsp:Transcript_9502/g.24119  ORF Transcript_9502/g.24119 Transcript_9502/m.24119 type:complete len:274 (+) Transcript_9502:138-959(+)